MTFSFNTRLLRTASLVIMAALLMVFSGLLLATPTLNFDDLGYGEYMPLHVANGHFWYFFYTFLFNLDWGVSQLRTYGLARAIQLIAIAPAGIAPAPTYAFMLLAHGLGAWVMYRFMRLVSVDIYIAACAAIAWFAAPSVLPLLKVEHHFLYIVGPFTPLLYWAVRVQERDRLNHILSVGLLVMTWWLGEAALIAVAAAVLWFVISKRSVRVFGQAAIAALLLGLYVGYQIAFVRDPTVPQRVAFSAPKDNAVGSVLAQIGESGRAILGFPHYDAEVGDIGGFPLIDAPVTGAVFIIALIAVLAAFRTPPSPSPTALPSRWRGGAVLLSLIAVLSICVFALFTVFQMGAMATRYTAAFYALVPIALMGLGAAFTPQPIARGLAGVIAAATLALAIGSLYQAEVLVNQPNRALLAAQTPGTAIVLRHTGWEASDDGVANVSYPGFTSTLWTGLQNPMRSAIVTEQVMRLYTGVRVGMACTFTSAGRVKVHYLGTVVAEMPRDKVKAFGLAGRDRSFAEPRALEDVCKTEAPPASPP
jgi:hypothetical protein